MAESILKGLPLMNESLGLENDSNFKIYRIKDQDKIQKLLDKEPNKSLIMENNFVTAEEMNGYSKLIKKEMDTIKGSIESLKGVKESSKITESSSLEERVGKLEKYADYLAENLEASIKYGEYLAENLEDSVSYSKYLAENLDKSISYAKYLAEHLDHNISYSEYIAENVDSNVSAVKGLTEKVDQSIAYAEYVAENVDKNIKYSEYLAENLDKNISYSEYLAENVDKNISYSEYLAENLDKGLAYSEYLAEKLDKNISYSEYLAENLDKGLAYSDYLGENLDKTVQYSEYIAEKLANNISYAEYIAESVNAASGTGEVKEAVTKAISENTRTSGYAGDYTEISSKIDNLLNTVGKQKTEEIAENKNYPFLKLMGEQGQREFLSLHEGQKQKVAKSLNESNYSSEKEVVEIMGKALNEQNQSGEKFLDLMPEKYKTAWENMNESQKASILAQSKFHKLDTPYQIQNFWATRGLTVTKANIERIDESQEQIIAASQPKGISREYLDNLSEALEARFKK
jgi:glutamine synthetase adenylyltransferase